MKFMSHTISNGRPERKDITARIEEMKRKQDEEDKKAESQRSMTQAVLSTR